MKLKILDANENRPEGFFYLPSRPVNGKLCSFDTASLLK